MVTAEEFIDALNSAWAEEDLKQYQDTLKHIMQIVGKHGRVMQVNTPHGTITLDPLTIRNVSR